jgi:uncharacterized protein YdcH (DUF465 family)
MFESQQAEMEHLIESNTEFKALYNDHKQLEKRVTAAENGTAPMSNDALNQLKREKLRIKDKLTRLMEAAQS